MHDTNKQAGKQGSKQKLVRGYLGSQAPHACSFWDPTAYWCTQFKSLQKLTVSPQHRAGADTCSKQGNLDNRRELHAPQHSLQLTERTKLC